MRLVGWLVESNSKRFAVVRRSSSFAVVVLAIATAGAACDGGAKATSPANATSAPVASPSVLPLSASTRPATSTALPSVTIASAIAAAVARDTATPSLESPTTAPAAPAGAEPAPNLATPAATDTPLVDGSSPDPAATAPTSTPPPPRSTPVAVITLPPPSGQSYTPSQATSLLNAATIRPGDVGPGWAVASDVTYDNAAAAAGDAANAALFERCGRLLGRIVEDRPVDLIGAYVAFAPVSLLAQLTAYATASGAADCTAQLRARYLGSAAQFASALGVFDNPNLVQMSVVDFATIGDESFAATLTGRVSTGGNSSNVTVLIVLFRSGNLRGALAVTRAALAPGNGTDQLTPLLNIFLERIAAHR